MTLPHRQANPAPDIDEITKMQFVANYVFAFSLLATPALVAADDQTRQRQPAAGATPKQVSFAGSWSTQFGALTLAARWFAGDREV